jgi:hypothetical protein
VSRPGNAAASPASTRRCQTSWPPPRAGTGASRGGNCSSASLIWSSSSVVPLSWSQPPGGREGRGCRGPADGAPAARRGPPGAVCRQIPFQLRAWVWSQPSTSFRFLRFRPGQHADFWHGTGPLDQAGARVAAQLEVVGPRLGASRQREGHDQRPFIALVTSFRDLAGSSASVRSPSKARVYSCVSACLRHRLRL